jgi:uncharacterized protein
MIEGLLFTLSLLLCLIALGLSALAFSGTWLVLLAALITFFATDVPGVGTLIAFALLCIFSEIAETIAGSIGVQKRGGSKWAGLAALVGGLIGAVIGTPIIPVLGTFLGMLLGSFVLAFLVEWKRLKHHEQAASIAWGAIWARLIILLLKTALTLGMSLWLLIGLLHQ